MKTGYYAGISLSLSSIIGISHSTGLSYRGYSIQRREKWALKSPTSCYASRLPFQRLAVVCSRFNPPASAAGSGTRVRIFAADGLRSRSDLLTQRSVAAV